MQPAIPIGTLLQNRYRVVQLLGQGGFGRTYLAEDQGRFNERCALKEFVPLQGEDRFSDKATQLFQREAAILYQISHPQIPQFRATFEQDQRLFLIQDYVEGITYRDLLNQRRSQGRAFSETEIRQFLQQILPVLAHIHAKGIIHRDISPDNIILRRSDQAPVLIDFGVVKEVVTRLQLDGAEMPATTVGKLGYAPSEQMQTGRAYPSSDLYSLAVTAVVLLTGKEPQDLFDDVNLTWSWQQHAQVSPALAQILNRALNYRPGDRFQSVSQMAQALAGQTVTPAAPAQPELPSQSVAPPQQAAATPPLSEMRTVAVGRPNPADATVNRPPRPKTRTAPLPPSAQQRSGGVLENPWAVTAIGFGSAVVAGVGGWAVVNVLSQPAAPPTPTITPLPELTASPTPTPTNTPSPPPEEPTEYDQPLSIAPGDSQTVEGSVRGGNQINYTVQGQAGQTLSAALQGEGVLLSVLGPEGEAVADDANRTFRWSGPLEADGEYTIQLSPVQGLSRSDYQLEVGLTAAPEPGTEPGTEPGDEPGDEPDIEPSDPSEGEPTEPNTPPEEAPPQVEILEQRVQIPGGEEGVTVANGVGPGRVRRYVVNARQGQIITVKFTQANGPVTFDVMLPGGELMDDASGVLFWQSYLPVGGDYVIDVKSPNQAEFTMEIQIAVQN
ncbi:MAG: protein kinase [Cyanobacteria bacterium P01_G01_bin.38]